MKFGDKERLRQANFRDISTTISSRARKIDSPKMAKNPHLLRLGFESQNLYPGLRGSAGAAKYFSQRHIQWWRNARSGDDLDRTGPTRNMASSQVACINFLLPLMEQRKALTALLKTLDSDIAEVVDIESDGLAAPVELEWIRVAGSTLEGGKGTRGANTTSVDALVVAKTVRNRRRAYLIEWKYVEEYKTGEYKGEGASGDTRRQRYIGHYSSAKSSFIGKVPFDAWLYEPFYQILRLRLLADRMIEVRELEIDDARVVVVCPKENTDYHMTITSPDLQKLFPRETTVEGIVKKLLRDPRGILFTSPRSFLDGVRESSAAVAMKDWIGYQEDRYGW